MELYLMQHGACLSEDIDPARPLSPVGSDTAAKAGRTLRAFGVRPGLIVSSPKLRARQTAAIVARELEYPAAQLAVHDSLNPMGKPDEALSLLKEAWDAESVLLVGHLPHLNHFVSRLACRSGEVNLSVENAGLTRIDLTQPLPGQGRISWHIKPFLYTLLK
ncbi:phosphohistidine phosphatase, SixA [Desulfovibrio sp. X2]|uniref:phosphohistidine phosphatase SixA n=1 Tax=Desulfovibrio sp. X2 TaxID=941449 RepID=UPI000358EA37|nr:phosphohistidine phosphatase SixA [Desulfovibrio sp. X2]EPR44064.1 phosphohistidine phosphatase, SixA [Desulfovibrio sp. X2]